MILANSQHAFGGTESSLTEDVRGSYLLVNLWIIYSLTILEIQKVLSYFSVLMEGNE
jgi:hypothetical protein